MSDDHHLTRRQTLGALGVAGAGVLLGGRLDLGPASPVTAAQAASACALTAAQEEGPFFVDLERIRRNIVGTRTGLPLVLRIKVVNAKTCAVVKGAAIDVWHADGIGRYSDESSQGTVGQTWLRGVQLTDASGVAEFRTIYPGFYQGRCPHIHVKVHVGGTSHGTTYSGGHVSYTGQLFFPEAASTQVYRHAPYTNDTNGRTRNSADHVYTQQHGSKSVLKLRRRGSLSQGFVGSAVVSIDPSATG